jgi:transglutaminase-like putative cysteine protease
MHYSIRYLTEYRYDTPVTDNLNALRVKPATTATQRVEDFIVRVDPDARLHRHADYFGTDVIEFGIVRAHESLTIDVRARVINQPAPAPPEAPWETLEQAAYRRAGIEYLQQTEPVPPTGALDELTAQVRARTPLSTLMLVAELIPDSFVYRPGVTYVGSTVADLLEGGAGVCQDFVHLGLMLLRRLGIAARYVSGYLYAAPVDNAEDGASVEVDTHAWLEALLPGTNGSGDAVWVGVDPTNRGLADERHVKIGHGRTYSDVPPIKGLYRGGAQSQLDASVKMTRTDPATVQA